MAEATDETIDRYRKRYGLGVSEATRQVERIVIGGDWGANGYTTMAQADSLADHMGLAPGKRMLDIGSGRGWPGLYLCAITGCDAVLTDVPEEGLRLAVERIEREGLSSRCSVTVADGSDQPFRREVFDAVSHADVLC